MGARESGTRKLKQRWYNRKAAGRYCLPLGRQAGCLPARCFSPRPIAKFCENVLVLAPARGAVGLQRNALGQKRTGKRPALGAETCGNQRLGEQVTLRMAASDTP